MSKLVSQLEIEKFNKDGAVFLKNKFDIKWIEKLKKGIEKILKIRALDLNHIQQNQMSQLI